MCGVAAPKLSVPCSCQVGRIGSRNGARAEEGENKQWRSFLPGPKAPRPRLDSTKTGCMTCGRIGASLLVGAALELSRYAIPTLIWCWFSTFVGLKDFQSSPLNVSRLPNRSGQAASRLENGSRQTRLLCHDDMHNASPLCLEEIGMQATYRTGRGFQDKLVGTERRMQHRHLKADTHRGCTSSRPWWIVGAHDRAVHTQNRQVERSNNRGMWGSPIPGPGRLASGIAELNIHGCRYGLGARQRVPERRLLVIPTFPEDQFTKGTKVEAAVVWIFTNGSKYSQQCHITVDSLGERKAGDMIGTSGPTDSMREPAALFASSFSWSTLHPWVLNLDLQRSSIVLPGYVWKAAEWLVAEQTRRRPGDSQERSDCRVTPPAPISMGIYAKTSKRPVTLEQKSLTVVRVGNKIGLFQVGQSAKNWKRQYDKQHAPNDSHASTDMVSFAYVSVSFAQSGIGHAWASASAKLGYSLSVKRCNGGKQISDLQQWLAKLFPSYLARYHVWLPRQLTFARVKHVEFAITKCVQTPHDIGFCYQNFRKRRQRWLEQAVQQPTSHPQKYLIATLPRPEMSMTTLIHYGMLVTFRGSSARRSRQGNRHHLPECLPTKVRPTHAVRDARGSSYDEPRSVIPPSRSSGAPTVHPADAHAGLLPASESGRAATGTRVGVAATPVKCEAGNRNRCCRGRSCDRDAFGSRSAVMARPANFIGNVSEESLSSRAETGGLGALNLANAPTSGLRDSTSLGVSLRPTCSREPFSRTLEQNFNFTEATSVSKQNLFNVPDGLTASGYLPAYLVWSVLQVGPLISCC
ncbi:uncharacterized protein CLUP02_08825 [Colletotrichum lupini]|uniref:Uncharacterized protein n=1 Tax=Colletotrichum lupini TaxID=145971 RepID=A0A9Q8WI03_9PEZI|nr:uncharacterized protein CLUP02_08825 [Colletotrichum lupini]UQC83330.1 hypothetical protein CLUP02_08825 [Colletotrichum lupini]